MSCDTQTMFELQCLVKNVKIKLCTRIESGVKQLLALVTREEDVILHYAFGELPAVLKRVPWYVSKNRVIQAICFDPTATWLLLVCVDSSLHIIPFLSLVDKKQKVDCKWSTNDLTHFPKAPQAPDCKPTAVVWWQTLDSNQNGLIGYENGSIALISLTDGRCLATCTVSEPISELKLCQDDCLDVVFLLICCLSGQQWKHILEQRLMGYVWPPELTNQTDDSTRSRLQSLRQMGVDKLTSLKQRLVEGRTQKKDSSSDTTSESSVQSDNSHNGPELLTQLQDTQFSPQYAKDRYLFSAFYKPSNLVTVHGVDIDAAPLCSYKLPTDTKDFLLNDKLIFVLNFSRSAIEVVSTNLSECRFDGEAEFNSESIVAKFELENETVLGLYRAMDLSGSRCRKHKDDKLFEIPKSLDDLNLRKPRIDTCVVVTTRSVYKVHVSVSPVNMFVELIMEGYYKQSERISTIFGLNEQLLLEACGDLYISRGFYHSGIILYKRAKVHLLKRVLKLAIAADCKTLLKFVHLCLGASKVDMSVATKIHVGNLAVMAYTELILRYGGQNRVANTKDFMNFLKNEEFYDQVLAVNVACQASHWRIVELLATARGLQPEVVAAYGQILKNAEAAKYNDLSFFHALSEPSLAQSLLLSPDNATVICQYVRTNVEKFPVDILRRFVLQLDPSQPCAVPIVSRKFISHKSASSLESTLDSCDFEYQEKRSELVKDLIETFLVVSIHLIHKTTSTYYNLTYLEKIKPSDEIKHEDVMAKFPDVQPLSCGYEHAAIVRNDFVYTMGVSSSSCLGLGPLLSQSSPPKLVETLAALKVKVISVSCGRRHTLFLTDYGVYACGSNNYGQLGLGASVQASPYPQIISALAFEKIVEVVCGQYHSMALTADGRVYTWGWGIHGQLGHGNCDNLTIPKQLAFEGGVKQIAAGHAHSLVLNYDGQLFGFGSNVFGQLECSRDEPTPSKHCSSNKHAIPIRIHVTPNVESPIKKIASGYFHNLAAFEDRKIYAWGANPQEHRVFQARNYQKSNAKKSPDSWKESVHVYTGSDRAPISQISIGYRHTAILHNGKILWGKNKEDELNPPRLRDQDTLSILDHRFLHVSCGLDYTMAIDHIGRLLAWGSDSMAQTLFGRALDKEDRKTDERMIISKSTRRILRFPVNNNKNTDQFPIEVPGIPTMIITFTPTDHQSIFSKNQTPFLIMRLENTNFLTELPTKFNIGSRTLHFILETYYTLYDSDYIQHICNAVGNHQAASKIAILGEHYCDSLNYQLKAFKELIDAHREEFQTFCEEYESEHKKAAQGDSINGLKNGDRGGSEQLLSSSSSLDSMRLWEDQEHQGGCESPCEAGEIDDIRYNMSQFVQSLKNNQLTPPITSISKLVSETTELNNGPKFEIANKNVRNIIETACTIVEFYTKKIHSSENHILMQNVLMQCIEFWLANGLPVSILEAVLLKNMDKYFYPLSILLFCKDFSTDDQVSAGRSAHKNSARFLKEFSTKFCLQLCLMVVENVNKT